MSTHHRVRTNRRRLLALVLCFASAALATGCTAATDTAQSVVSSEPTVEEDPRKALQDAVASLGEWAGIEAAVRSEADAAVRADAIADGGLGRQELELLFGASVMVRATGLDAAEDAAFETSIIVDGAPVFDLQVNGEERIFVRVDAEAISTLSADTDLGDIDDLVVGARMFGLEEVAQAAVEGRWLELIGIAEVRELTDVEEAEDREIDDGELDDLATRLTTSLERFVDDAAVGHVGSDDVGERVRMTTDGASLEAFFDEVTTEFDRAGLLDVPADQPIAAPDVDDDLLVSIDAWIDDGELRQIAVDLSGFDQELSDELLIVVGLEEFTGTITEPEGAEPFDLRPLANVFSGGAGGGPAGNDLFGDLDEHDPFAGSGDDLDGDEVAPPCIPQEELDLIEEFEGTEALDELESLFDAGILERC